MTSGSLQEPRMSETLRLASYNLLEGLRPLTANSTERRALDRRRLEAAKSVVESLAPDILVLNEALFCRAYEGKRIDYAELFSFPIEVAALYDREWGNAILSRYPIVRSREMRIYNRGGLTALIDSPLGRLTVASYHPHPRRHPDNKALDFANLVEDLDGPLIICGDLNCISPEDHVDVEELVAAFRSFTTDAEGAITRFIDSGKVVFAHMARLGLRDAVPLKGRRYSIPTDLINTDKSSAMRIDHILCSKEIDVVAGEVVHNTWTEIASDHHPVMIDFRLRRKSQPF